MSPEPEETRNALRADAAKRTLVLASELRRHRLAAGLSLAELARLLHYSKGHLSKIENGRLAAGTDLVRRYDTAVGAGGRLAALVEQPVAPVTGESGGEVWLMRMAADGAVWAVPMNRRDALSVGVSSWMGLHLAPRGIQQPAALRPALDGFRVMFDQIRQLGQVTGPGSVLPIVMTQTQVVRGMAASAMSAAVRVQPSATRSSPTSPKPPATWS